MRPRIAHALIVTLIVSLHLPAGTAGSAVVAVASAHPMAPVGRISGKIVADESSRPLAGAYVTVVGAAFEAQTYSDTQAQFAMPAIPVHANTVVTVVVTADGYGDWTLTNARLFAADTLILDVRLKHSATRIDLPAMDSAEQGLISAAAAIAQLGPRMPLYLSQTTSPPTIRVRVTGQVTCSTSITYQVETVDFKEYAKHVLPNEWIASWAGESLRSGAMAVKTYAWYWVNQGGKWPDADVYDSTCDQVYNPAMSYASTNAAVDDTWSARMLYRGQVFQATYRAHAAQCPPGLIPGCLGQWESSDLANQGFGWRYILGQFYQNIAIYDGPQWPAFVPIALR